mgnify:CR=1 FL=1
MKYADSLVLALVTSGLLLLGLIGFYAHLIQEFAELVFNYLVPGGTVVGAIFTISDLKIPAFRKQAVVALIICALLFGVDSLVLWNLR